MNNTKKSTIGYQMHGFINRLGLKNTEKNLYALIYSFTMGERGIYHGSRKYLAEILDVSLRTVQYCLAKLFERKLIENATTEDGRFKGIRCIIKEEKDYCKKPSAEKIADAASLEKNAASAVIENKRDASRYDSVYDRMITARYGNLPEQEMNTFRMMYKYERGGDNRKFLRFGREGDVKMTEMQYKRLLEILPTEELIPYFSKFEAMLSENLKNGHKFPHSHYKVIRKWIEEDLAL